MRVLIADAQPHHHPPHEATISPAAAVGDSATHPMRPPNAPAMQESPTHAQLTWRSQTQ
ncbi:hypothetical protein DSM3645_07525 [Blastopirellula marina DSM 3645]|uniref:Uncharacterized protein n=1 Tax=Blastopirellula marina DSM 3645 TaxID=314230 RepID=A3ZXN2_9BACT|nr:hypothetical protein DSM3645_07525 [Blastopirellula marina DSM 3645]